MLIVRIMLISSLKIMILFIDCVNYSQGHVTGIAIGNMGLRATYAK